MSIGFGIFLMAVGAILAFGVRDRSGAIDLSVVGVIIMLAGACGIWLSFSITNRRRRVETQAIDPAVEEEYRAVQEEPPAVEGQPPVLTSDDETERHVELDPKASGLQIEVPDRRVPVHAEAKQSASFRSRLKNRFR